MTVWRTLHLAFYMNGFLNIFICLFLVSPLWHLRKKETNTCFSNSTDDRFRLVADFVESEFLNLF